MKIGYIQSDIRFGQKEHNLGHLNEFLLKTAELDIVVLPELCNVGYAFKNRDELLDLAEEFDTGQTTRFFRERAHDLETLIIAGFAERSQYNVFNSSAAFFPDGNTELYRKTHLFNTEKKIFTPGNTGFSVFEFKGTRIALMICFDWHFPEAWLTLALKGAQIVCMSADLVLPGKAQKAIPVMSMMNRYFTICANRIGTERGITFTGGSLIADPEGTVLCESPPDTEEMRFVEIDPSLSLNKWATPNNHILKDRKSQFYES